MADVYEGLDPLFAARLKAMVDASGGRIILRGGSYGARSYEDQLRLWNDAVKRYGSEAAARKWVAVPGKSNHGRGTAYDLGYNGDGQAWAQANAARYGLHFPMGHEPWHIEPVKTALDEHFDPEAYTDPPIGQPAAGDPNDIGFQMTRMLAMLDEDLNGAMTTPTDAVATPGDQVMQAASGQLDLDDGAAMQNYGFQDLEPANEGDVV